MIMTRSGAGRWISLFAVGLAAACGGAAHEAPPAGSSAGAKPASKSRGFSDLAPASKAADDATEVTVENPGSPPRRKLRYKFTAGPSQWMQLDLKVGMVAEGKSTSMPFVRNVFRVDPKAVGPEGDLRLEFEVVKAEVMKDASVSHDVLRQLEASSSKLVGAKGSATVTARGLSKDVTLAPPPGLGKDGAELVEGMSRVIHDLFTPFPEEEVGKGARWDAIREFSNGQVRLLQLASHELRELSPQAAFVTTTIAQKKPGDDVAEKKVGDARVQIQGARGAGEGKAAIQFEKLIPKSSLTMSSVMDMQVDSKEGSGATSVGVNMDVFVQPLAAPPK